MIQYDTKNWIAVIFRVHGTVLPRIIGRTLFVAAIGALLAWTRVERGLDLPTGGTVHAMVGVALGLLLVFRTNASYDRFWEGRKMIGGLVNNCRDLSRQSGAYLAGSSPEVRARVRRQVIALYGTIRHYLRRETDLADLADVLDDAERRALAAHSAPPLLVASWLTETFAAEHRAGRLSPQELQLLDATLGDVIDLWGGAERILKTPVPFAYAHHIKGFLTLFCITSPLALVDAMQWWTPAAAAIVAYGLYGIDEIGVEIEDPFGYDPNDLDLDGAGQTIAKNVGETLKAA
jgi:putative membrane protein